MKKIKEFIIKHPIITLIVMSVLLGFLTILSGSTVSSLLYQNFVIDNYVKDGNMFYYIAKMISNGKTPYLEIFDHKGLYLFYYISLGYLMGGRVGLFFVEGVLMSLTYFFMILSLRELKTQKSLIFTFMLLFLAFHSVSGQFPSDFELNLPFIALMTYFYSRGFNRQSDKDYLIGNAVAGIQAGIAINIRAVDTMVALGFVIGFFVICLRHKKIKEIFINAGVCLAALIFACLPALIHSLTGGFAKEMYTSIILDNFKYVGTADSRLDSSQVACRILVITLAIIYFVPLIINRRKMISDEFWLSIAEGIVVFLIQIIVAFYPHYVFIILPFYFVVVTRSVSLFFKEEKKWHLAFKIPSAMIALASLMFLPMLYNISLKGNEQKIINEVKENIPEEDRKNGHVLGIGISAAIYLNCDIDAGYPDVCCQYNHVLLSSYYTYDKLLDYLQSGDCHYVILTKGTEYYESNFVIQWFYNEGETYYTMISNESVNIFHYSL